MYRYAIQLCRTDSTHICAAVCVHAHRRGRSLEHTPSCKNRFSSLVGDNTVLRMSGLEQAGTAFPVLICKVRTHEWTTEFCGKTSSSATRGTDANNHVGPVLPVHCSLPHSWCCRELGPLLGQQAVPRVCAICPRPHSTVTGRDPGCHPSAWLRTPRPCGSQL